MINIKSFSKKATNNNSSNGSSGGFVTTVNTNTVTELDTHLLWGQPFNGTQDVSGDLSNVGNISANGDIIANGDITAADSNFNSVTTNDIESNSGTIDNLVSALANITNLNVDNLTAKVAHFFELSIDEVKSVGGQMIITPANATLDIVEKNGDTYECYFICKDGDKEIDNQFAVNDQVVCSTFNITDNGDTHNKFYWAKIIEVESNVVRDSDTNEYHKIVIDWTDKDIDTNGIPQAGDKIAQLGNRTDTDRQAAIIISAYNNQFLDANIVAPSIVQYNGINDYNLSNHRLNVISNGLNSFKGNFQTEAGETLDDAVSNIESLYDNPNLFGMATYNGNLTELNKFFIEKGTSENLYDNYYNTYDSYVQNTYFSVHQYNSSGEIVQGYFYTPYFKCDIGQTYTLAISELNFAGLKLTIDAVLYNTAYDAINNTTNNTVLNLAVHDTETEDLEEYNYLKQFTNNTGGIKYCRIRFTMESDYGADLDGSTIMMFKGNYLQWDKLPKIPNIYSEASSQIVQNSREIRQTVRKVLIGNKNLLQQTNFTSLDNMNLWKQNLTLNGEVVDGLNSGVNAYKIHISANNTNILSQRVNYYGIGEWRLEPNKTYTFSCYFKDIATNTQPIIIDNVTFSIYSSDDYSNQNYLVFAQDFVYTDTNLGWQKFTATFTMPQRQLDYAYLVLRTFNLNTETDWYICQPKLEVGASATDYYQEISDASTSLIEQTADRIRLQVENCGIDITNQKISLNGDTDVNGTLTISDEDTGFILQGEGGATQISPKSVGTYNDFINNSNTTIERNSIVNGVSRVISDTSKYSYAFRNTFNFGNISAGKILTFKPITLTYWKYGTILNINLTPYMTNQTYSIKIYENGQLQNTITSLSSFNYTTLGTGEVTITADITADIQKSYIDDDTPSSGILVKYDVKDIFSLSCTIPNDAYTLLGFDGMGINFGTSANVYFNKDNAVFRYGNYGLRINSLGIDKYYSGEWIPMEYQRLYYYNGTSLQMTNDYDVVVTTNSNTVSIQLPSFPTEGKQVWIRKNGSGNINVTADRNMRSGYSGTVSSYQVNNAKLCCFLFDGHEWLINYLT